MEFFSLRGHSKIFADQHFFRPPTNSAPSLRLCHLSSTSLLSLLPQYVTAFDTIEHNNFKNCLPGSVILILFSSGFSHSSIAALSPLNIGSIIQIVPSHLWCFRVGLVQFSGPTCSSTLLHSAKHPQLTIAYYTMTTSNYSPLSLQESSTTPWLTPYAWLHKYPPGLP